jgi:FAD binding domain
MAVDAFAARHRAAARSPQPPSSSWLRPEHARLVTARPRNGPSSSSLGKCTMTGTSTKRPSVAMPATPTMHTAHGPAVTTAAAADGITSKPVELVDALIIGGGPAGLAAAIVLAGRGYRVTVAERAAALTHSDPDLRCQAQQRGWWSCVHVLCCLVVWCMVHAHCSALLCLILHQPPHILCCCPL